MDEGPADDGAGEKPTGDMAVLAASIERGMPWLLAGWAVGLLVFLVVATEALGLDEAEASTAPLVFLLATATAILLLTAFAFAARTAWTSTGWDRVPWILALLGLSMALLPALANISVVQDQDDLDEEDECHRWGILPAWLFDPVAMFFQWVSWPLYSSFGLTLGAAALGLLVWPRTRRPGGWLLGAFMLAFLLTLGALDGCPDL